MSNGSLDWNRLEDLLQSNENLRAGNRAESDSKVAREEPVVDESDPWAVDYKPWPSPRSVNVPNPASDSFRSQALISSTTNQIFGVDE